MAGDRTLWRFSLYGFLKNQQYYDPFLLLAFRQMGVSYTWYGLLIAFREIMTNIMEVPSGAIADLFGKRKSMIVSFAAYIISFGIFGGVGLMASRGELSQLVLRPMLFGAMFFFAIGDAFRTGTHKAMIFTWLRINGRTDERTKVYGYTRSWSKIGSAVSVVLACIFVFLSQNFIYIFFFAIVPYILNIINFLGYPSEVDSDTKKNASVGEILAHLREAFRDSFRNRDLRRLIGESMAFGGMFKAAKDYLQPILQAAAVLLTARLFVGSQLSDVQKSVVLIGPVFVILYLASAAASRKAHVLATKLGSEDRTAKWLRGVKLVVFLLLLPGLYFGVHPLMIVGFVVLYIIQNLWRPVLVSRFDAHSDEGQGATILSIESQGKSVATMIIAPTLGFAIDTVKARGWVGAEGGEFWPIAVIGSILALLFFATAKTKQPAS